MIKKKVRKEESLHQQKRNHGFSFMKIMMLIFFLNLGRISICQDAATNSFSWLYTENGSLIADQRVKMDPSIVNCLSKTNDYTDYLFNRILILNEINPTSYMIKTGVAPTLLLKVYLRKYAFSTYIVDNIVLEDTSSSHLEDYTDELFKQLIGLKLYSICGGDFFYIHLPVKFNFNLVDQDQEVGITKYIENGWFVVSTVTNSVIVN